mmetsp:Transcript_4741/g.14152  ORF Transcript_4741/g.14152 Transcript_4741/m.14152 type:complete len:176 (+) Transcript_4741:632-1159(+)
MAMAYGVNAQAVGKVVLHGAKYGAGEVCGALLGRWDGAEDGPVLVEDAVPFFHKCENKYSPLMEVALAQAESYASTVGLKVVGFYQANERNDDGSLHASTKRIGDAVRDKSGFPKACLLLLNNEGFTSFLSGEAADRYDDEGGGRRRAASGREATLTRYVVVFVVPSLVSFRLDL